MNLNSDFTSRMSQRLRHWLPHLLASLLVNLVLLTLFPQLLESGFSNPQLPAIEVTLSSPKVRESAEMPIEKHKTTPVKTKPVEIESAPKATPTPKLQPQAAKKPPANPKPAVTEKEATVEPQKAETPLETTVEKNDSPPPLRPIQSPPAKVSLPPLPTPTPLYKLSRMPQFAQQQAPAYPEDERAMGREAKVLAEVFIDAEGEVISVKIIQSGGQDFDQAVTDALQASRFQPGYVGSRAVAVRFQIPFEFQLD